MLENEKLLRDILFIFKEQKLKDEQIHDLFENCYLLVEDWFEIKGQDYKSIHFCKSLVLPVMEKFIKASKKDYLPELYKLYMKMYALCGRRDLECFIDYMESDRVYRVLDSRRSVLMPFVDSLNRLLYDDKLKMVVASYPPSTGKSFCMNYFTAFCFGIDINNSVLRISYSDDLVSGFSRSIKDIISSQLFADIFPNFVLYGGKVFDKDKETDWKIKGADLITNHYARTRGGPITGVRANTAIIIDDITKGAEEATSVDVHNNIYNKWTTEWINRYDNRPNKPRTKFVVAGTMWCPDDLLNRVREDEEKYSKLKASKKYKYVWETDDAIFIRIPALDENDESTCPSVSSTQEYLRLRDKMDPYLFSCVYQQDPIAPSGLEFNWDLINTYTTLPRDENGIQLCSEYTFASLDPARKGKDYVSMPIHANNNFNYYMVDVLYQQKAMTELYDSIVDKIISNKVIKLALENNTDVSLKEVLEMKLKEKQYPFCEIVEKYATVVKEKRIKDTRGIIKRQIYFKEKNLISPNSEYGKFMKDFTTYSFDYPNKHDDAPDSLALFTTEIILGNSILPDAIPVNRSDIRF